MTVVRGLLDAQNLHDFSDGECAPFVLTLRYRYHLPGPSSSFLGFPHTFLHDKHFRLGLQMIWTRKLTLTLI